MTEKLALRQVRLRMLGITKTLTVANPDFAPLLALYVRGHASGNLRWTCPDCGQSRAHDIKFGPPRFCDCGADLSQAPIFDFGFKVKPYARATS